MVSWDSNEQDTSVLRRMTKPLNLNITPKPPVIINAPFNKSSNLDLNAYAPTIPIDTRADKNIKGTMAAFKREMKHYDPKMTTFPDKKQVLSRRTILDTNDMVTCMQKLDKINKAS